VSNLRPADDPGVGEPPADERASNTDRIGVDSRSELSLDQPGISDGSEPILDQRRADERSNSSLGQSSFDGGSEDFSPTPGRTPLGLLKYLHHLSPNSAER
jgi:hypothetical protein